MTPEEKLAQGMVLADSIRPAITAMIDHCRGDIAPVLFGLAQAAGDIIGTSGGAAHVEEGLDIFAGLTADQARGRLLSTCSRGQGGG